MKYITSKYIFTAIVFILAARMATAQTIIAKGGIWKYNDSGSSLGTAWRLPTYIDTSWNSNNALLGFGNITAEAIATQLSYGSNASSKYPAYYFRKTFNYTVTGSEINFEINALIDDGAIFYINGIEVKRLNMPTGTISYSTLASTDGNESSYQQFFLPANALVNGSNLIAVEVHQSSLSSSDIGFNMELIAHTNTIINPPSAAAISKIHFGSTDTPLSGFTITWQSKGLTDSIKWGYTSAYESGKYAAVRRNNYTDYLYDYNFPQIIRDTVIHYAIRDTYSNAWTSDKIFYTLKQKDADHFIFNAMGDSRTNLNDWNTISSAVKPADFMLFNGDLVNAGGNTSDWEGWFTNGINFFEKNLVYYTPGNHDIVSDATAINYRNFMVMPPNPGNELYYSFTVGNSIFICLDSNDPANIVQYNWLISTLEANKDKKWRIVFFHKPFYTSPSHVGEMDPYYPTWWKAFDDYGVELIFNGHTHNYQRTIPINRNISQTSGVSTYGHCSNNGRCQIVAGSAGAPSAGVGSGWFLSKSFNIMHYVNVNVAGDTLIIKAINQSNAVIDSFMIFKSLEININSTALSYCVNDTVKVNLTSKGGNGNELKWYKNILGSNYQGSGNSIILPLSKDTTTTYYAAWETASTINSYAKIKLKYTLLQQDTSTWNGNIYSISFNACNDSIIKNIPVSIKSLPEGIASINGLTTVCKGQNSVKYSVPKNTNITSYIWSLPSGTNGSSTSDTIIVQYTNNASSGNVTVKAVNSCGVGAVTNLPVVIKSLPQITGNITGLDTVLQGQNNIPFTIPAASNANSYIWYLPHNASGNSNTNTINLNFNSSSLSGNLSVKANNECGNSDSVIFYINVIKQLRISLFLSGYYATDSFRMNKAQNEYGDQFPSNITDTVSIYLNDTIAPFTVIHSFTNVALRRSGLCNFSIPAEIKSKYYISIHHRNHLETWSSAPVLFVGDTLIYNFTTAANKAYGNNQMQIQPGIYGFYGGDINQDGLIDGTDMSAIETDNNNFINGYVITDINGDGLIDGTDMSIVEFNNNHFVGAVSPE